MQTCQWQHVTLQTLGAVVTWHRQVAAAARNHTALHCQASRWAAYTTHRKYCECLDYPLCSGGYGGRL